MTIRAFFCVCPFLLSSCLDFSTSADSDVEGEESEEREQTDFIRAETSYFYDFMDSWEDNGLVDCTVRHALIDEQEAPEPCDDCTFAHLLELEL